MVTVEELKAAASAWPDGMLARDFETFIGREVDLVANQSVPPGDDARAWLTDYLRRTCMNALLPDTASLGPLDGHISLELLEAACRHRDEGQLTAHIQHFLGGCVCSLLRMHQLRAEDLKEPAGLEQLEMHFCGLLARALSARYQHEHAP